MTGALSASMPEWEKVEGAFSALFSRVARRAAQVPADPADGAINATLQQGLRASLSQARQFTALLKSHVPPLERANGLLAFACATSHMVTMIRTLENAPPSSPLFERLMDREHAELRRLMGDMHHAIMSEADALLALPAEEAAPATKDSAAGMLPFMLGPAVMAYGMTIFWMNAWAQALLSPPQPKVPHLRLVTG